MSHSRANTKHVDETNKSKEAFLKWINCAPNLLNQVSLRSTPLKSSLEEYEAWTDLLNHILNFIKFAFTYWWKREALTASKQRDQPTTSNLLGFSYYNCRLSNQINSQFWPIQSFQDIVNKSRLFKEWEIHYIGGQGVQLHSLKISFISRM